MNFVERSLPVKVWRKYILPKLLSDHMSTLVSRSSPVTGKIEWLIQDDNYDFQQEIAR